jgi:hypothetical protein
MNLKSGHKQEKTFFAGFEDHVIKGGENLPNVSNGNLPHNLIYLLSAKSSKARGCLKFDV